MDSRFSSDVGANVTEYRRSSDGGYLRADDDVYVRVSVRVFCVCVCVGGGCGLMMGAWEG